MWGSKQLALIWNEDFIYLLVKDVRSLCKFFTYVAKTRSNLSPNQCLGCLICFCLHWILLVWLKCEFYKSIYCLWLKKSDSWINAILVISELMASVNKTLRHFRCSGEKFTSDLLHFWVKRWSKFLDFLQTLLQNKYFFYRSY